MTDPAPVQQPGIEDVLTVDGHAALRSLAAGTRVPAGSRFIFLGDSITARYHEQDRKFPELIGQVIGAEASGIRIVNAGLRGDSALKVGARLEQDVLAQSPTVVFIHLGMNDSKLIQPDLAANYTPLETYEACCRRIIGEIFEKTSAKVVVLGISAVYEPWTRAATVGGKTSYFGAPEQLRRYNERLQRIAAELACPYVDLVAAFMRQPDLKALFTEPDGVHPCALGQELIALEVMRCVRMLFPA